MPDQTSSAAVAAANDSLPESSTQAEAPVQDILAQAHAGLNEAAPKPKVIDLNSDEPLSGALYINRELSWLAFNQRVIEEAENPRHPLLERLRFLSISANNLDEFYMVRVAGLQGQVREAVRVLSADGHTPAQQLEAVNLVASQLMAAQQKIWLQLRGQLSDVGLTLIEPREVSKSDKSADKAGSAPARPAASRAVQEKADQTKDQAKDQAKDQEWLATTFENQLFPVLTPMAIDPAHPFPFIPNLGFSIVLKLIRRADNKAMYALVPIPTGVKRFWEVTSVARKAGDTYRKFISLENFVSLFLHELFPGFDITARGPVPHPARQRYRTGRRGRRPGPRVSRL